MLRNVWNALFPHDITEAPSGGCILIFCLSKNILKFKEFISVISTKKLQSTFFSGHPGTWSICWQLCSVGLHICSILWFRIGSISWKSESSKTSALWFNLAVGKCEILLSTHVYYIECKYCCFPVEGIEIYVFQVLFMESRVVWAFLQKTHTYVGAQHHWSPHKLTVVNCFMICMGLCLSTKTIIISGVEDSTIFWMNFWVLNILLTLTHFLFLAYVPYLIWNWHPKKGWFPPEIEPGTPSISPIPSHAFDAAWVPILQM